MLNNTCICNYVNCMKAEFSKFSCNLIYEHKLCYLTNGDYLNENSAWNKLSKPYESLCNILNRNQKLSL